MAKPRAPLSPQKISEAALAFIDRHGLEALSTRKLGAKLGVEGMALYKHFPSKDALLDAVTELLVLKLEVPPPGPGGWKALARAVGHSYRTVARQHPKAYPLMAARRLTTPRALAMLDQLFGRLLAEGLEPQTTVELYRCVLHYCTGAILDELAGFELEKAGTPSGTAPPMPELASLGKVRPWLGTDHFDALFEAGLERVISSFGR